jgi:hypothetical protein
VQNFIRDKASKFPALTIDYARGADATLIMKLADGGAEETISVEGWKSDAFEEFFEAKLMKA